VRRHKAKAAYVYAYDGAPPESPVTLMLLERMAGEITKSYRVALAEGCPKDAVVFLTPAEELDEYNIQTRPVSDALRMAADAEVAGHHHVARAARAATALAAAGGVRALLLVYEPGGAEGYIGCAVVRPVVAGGEA
jgi:hypothetical protein